MKSLTHSFNNNSFEIMTIFCIFDDLVKQIFPAKSVGRTNSLSLAEIATITLIRAKFGIPTLQQLYFLLAANYKYEFHLPKYKNFVETMNNYSFRLLIVLKILLGLNKKKSGVIKIVDSTPLPVCKNYRINTHRVMKQIAARSKSSLGWFYGLKLHFLIDLNQQVLSLKFTTGNVDDRVILDRFLSEIEKSIIVADAGYISSLLEQKAKETNNFLLTCSRKNMKKITTPLHIFLLNLRIRVESSFSVLKERFGLITSLPRSVNGYFAHYIRVIFAYMFKPLLAYC